MGKLLVDDNKGKQFVIDACLFALVNGGWSNWDTWSACSVTCGLGSRTRNRTCTNPTPSGTGKSCHGHAEDTVRCTDKPECPSESSPWRF